MNERVLLVENIHPRSAELFAAAGVSDLERLTSAIAPEDLAARIPEVSLLGIRSRTQVRAELLERAKQLQAIGCFCIGTNQVDIDFAQSLGVPVFNAPFANARSVAELTISSAISLMRDIPRKAAAAQRGEWRKAARGAYEVRKKKLGIVGYGNIGSQLSVLASGLGMHVYYYDVEAKLAHGNARSVASLDELLALSDIVTLHVPSTSATRGFIGRDQLVKMKPGAVLINYARGDLVDIDALADALEEGRLAGAAIDVYPSEPGGPDEPFVSPLQRFDNVILTPHIGGSTQEAQEAIGEEVAEKLLAYVREGATAKAVNFPNLAPPPRPEGVVRIAHIHQNVPGVMRAITDIVADAGLNICSQLLGTQGEIGYALTDFEGEAPGDVMTGLSAIPGTVRVRALGSPAPAGAA